MAERTGLLSRIVSYQITKRQRFVLMAFYLTVVLIFTQTVGENVRYQLVTFLAASTLFLSVFALWGELSGIKYLLLLILPIYFVTGSSLFYFLLPVRWLTRLPFALAFGISVYLLMLTANIFNVAAIRTIALLRAAHAVGLLFSLVATFFLLNVLFSLHLPFYIVVLGSILITTPLYLIELWSYELEDFISRRVGLYTGIFTVITAQFALVLSFWPVVPINGALIISTVMYVLLGLAQFAFADKLKRRQVYEHLGVALIVFIAVILTTKWGG